jgi:hypothetical protein
VQLKGDGARRLKRLEQQRLFAESGAATESEALPATEDAAVAAMDAQMVEEEIAQP